MEGLPGFGNVGSFAAYFLSMWGMKVVAVSDAQCGIFNPEGLPIPEMMIYARKDGTLSTLGLGETISNAALLTLDVDILNLTSIKHKILVLYQLKTYFASNQYSVMFMLLNNKQPISYESTSQSAYESIL